jgi:hypothetical protein
MSVSYHGGPAAKQWFFISILLAAAFNTFVIWASRKSDRAFGWRRLKIFLKREGIVMKDKRLRRLYREERLQVRPRKKRRVRLIRGNVLPAPIRINEEWGLDRLCTSTPRRRVSTYRMRAVFKSGEETA